MTGSISTDGSAVRVLVVLHHSVLVELVRLTLNHGVCTVRSSTAIEQVSATLTHWQPHLLILDMAHNGSGVLMQQVRATASAGPSVLVMGLVRQHDLASKLAAFDAGVDDILTMPFAAEELLTRALGAFAALANWVVHGVDRKH